MRPIPVEWRAAFAEAAPKLRRLVVALRSFNDEINAAKRNRVNEMRAWSRRKGRVK